MTANSLLRTDVLASALLCAWPRARPVWASLATALVLLAAVANTDAASRRRECLLECGHVVRACSDTCGPFGIPERACVKAALKRCRREGVDACRQASQIPPTTTTTPPCSEPTTTTLSATSSTTSTTVAPAPACPPNAAGGPDELLITTLSDGSDLDTGWTGVSHGFPLPGAPHLRFCLSSCDAGGESPECVAVAPIGPGSLNGDRLGPPLPLVAGGVPTCIVTRLEPRGLGGRANLVSGAFEADLHVLFDVHVSDITRVCPQCRNGTCDSGPNSGASCVVDGEVLVVNSLAADKNFKLSKTCVPGGTPVSTMSIAATLGTGTATTPGSGGSKPCRENEAAGVPVKDNDCGGACDAVCQLGTPACVEHVNHPSDPEQTVCRDAKGGLSQFCCSNNPGLACFPTEPGGPGIVRTGRPVPPSPPVPSTEYPKVSQASVLTATFCESATGNANIDTVAGLPGPGALILPANLEWRRQ